MTTVLQIRPPSTRDDATVAPRVEPPTWLQQVAIALRHRSVRVCALVGIAAALSIADLVVTLQHMTTTGMCEANPLARFVASGGPSALVAFKLTTVAFASAILIRFRRRRCAELGAWIAAAALAAVLVVWVAYAHTTAGVDNLASVCRGAWVQL